MSYLQEYVEVDETIPQKLRWKQRVAYRIKVGDPVGTQYKDGENTYYQFRLKGIRYKNHRVYYALKNKIDIKDTIVDHSTHNYIENTELREASHSQSSANRRPRKNKKYKGVYRVKNSNRFFAQIFVNKKRIGLGGYATEEEAAIAYNEAALKYFGEFAYLNAIPHKYCRRPEQRPNPPA